MEIMPLSPEEFEREATTTHIFLSLLPTAMLAMQNPVTLIPDLPKRVARL